jgi:hypothetical protein
MNKEELIALSDLNREDNIKYISSEAQGIAITLDSDRYAPTLCKLERAYICGRRKSEEQIAELEKENKVLAQNLEDTEILNKTYEKGFSDLEQENAELDCQKNRNKFCYSCANATERCFRNEIGCPCGKYKSYKDENAELIQENEEMKKGLGCETCQIHLEYMRLNNKIADLEKENTELKAGRDINVFTKQLTKAKDIIKKFLLWENNWHDKTESKYELLKQAEQFLKDCEVEK